MRNKFLEIRNIEKIFFPKTEKEFIVLQNISFSLYEGECTVITGDNGSGKSTFFNILAGMYPPTHGEILLEGKSLLHMSPNQISSLIYYVQQNPNENIFPLMSLEENLTLARMKIKHPPLNKKTRSEWRKEFSCLLKSLQIGLDKRIDSQAGVLSGGQKQALSLLMATLAKPKVLLLDEHLASLDSKMSKKIENLTLQIIKENKITTLLITHNILQGKHFGDRVLVFKKDLSNE